MAYLVGKSVIVFSFLNIWSFVDSKNLKIDFTNPRFSSFTSSFYPGNSGISEPLMIWSFRIKANLIEILAINTAKSSSNISSRSKISEMSFALFKKSSSLYFLKSLEAILSITLKKDPITGISFTISRPNSPTTLTTSFPVL